MDHRVPWDTELASAMDSHVSSGCTVVVFPEAQVLAEGACTGAGTVRFEAGLTSTGKSKSQTI